MRSGGPRRSRSPPQRGGSTHRHADRGNEASQSDPPRSAGTDVRGPILQIVPQFPSSPVQVLSSKFSVLRSQFSVLSSKFELRSVPAARDDESDGRPSDG